MHVIFFFVGIPATLLTDASRGVAAETTESMLARVKAAGSQVNIYKTIVVFKRVIQFYRNFNIIESINRKIRSALVKLVIVGMILISNVSKN